MRERLWTYPELKFIRLHQDDYSAEELRGLVNQKFHGGVEIRSERDIEKIKRGKTIFDKPPAR